MKFYLTEGEAAKRLNRSTSTLQTWRNKKKGPEYFKDGGGKIWYTEEALERFIEGPSQND